MYLTLWNKTTFEGQPSSNFYKKPEAWGIFKNLFLSNGLSEIVGDVRWETLEKSFVIGLANGLLTKAHFAIDNLFSNLCKSLNISKCKPRSSFTSKLELLINEMPNNTVILAKFGTFTAIRNSLHNNGIHKGNTDFCHTIKDKKNFGKDGNIETTSWDYLNILEIIIKHLEEILLSDKVKAISHITDEGAHMIRD
jgi:hypothetical protein